MTTVIALACLPQVRHWWTSRGSTDLGILVEQVVVRIEQGDFEALRAIDAEPGGVTQDFVARLQETHNQYDYRSLYQNAPPSVGANTYTLGGHSYRNMHMEFVKTGSRWRLQRVWMCR